jgi:hypothetical protein
MGQMKARFFPDFDFLSSSRPANLPAYPIANQILSVSVTFGVDSGGAAFSFAVNT